MRASVPSGNRAGVCSWLICGLLMVSNIDDITYCYKSQNKRYHLLQSSEYLISSKTSKRETQMTKITTEQAIGHIIFSSLDQAEAFIADATEGADTGESFVAIPYQGNRFHVARYFNGAFESYC